MAATATATWFFSLAVLLVAAAMSTMYYWRSSKQRSNDNGGRSSSTITRLPRKWPVVGMFPYVFANFGNLNNYLTVVLAAAGHNFVVQGPPLKGMRFFTTCDPENVRHVFTANLDNYPKGVEFAAIFDIMRGALFTVDGDDFRRERARFQYVLSDPRMLARMAACGYEKVKDGLLPWLDRMAAAGAPFDMQEVLMRFVFDLTAAPVFGVDPGLLSPDMPPLDCAAAMDTVMEAAFFRHLVPASCWKVMRWLRIGPEAKLPRAHATLQNFLTEMMARSKSSRAAAAIAGGDDEEAQQREEVVVSALSSYMDYPDDVLRATLMHHMIAGRDTTGTTLPWVFYNLARNPRVVAAIRDELAPIVASRKAAAAAGSSSDDDAMITFEAEETKPLIYLRAVLYETLRLYPAVPIERKTVAADDVMPSGHAVRAGDAVLVAIYSMGRMEALWGKDCHEFRPERWILQDHQPETQKKKMRYVPSHKFVAFNSGPRLCLGKEIAVMHMKGVVAAVVWNFDMEVLQGQDFTPKISCILQMKNGLMVKLKKRHV